jgi:adenylate kinase
MRLLLVAPPGAGKGTQAEMLAAHYGIAHLSSGDLLRKELAEDTEIGRAATAYVERGDLVPDDLIIAMLLGPIREANRSGGYVLDGFPRSLPQAEEAYRMARQTEGAELQAVIHLQVGRDELQRRLIARGEQEGRRDDNAATIAHRLDVYESETRPLLAFYAGRGLLVDIDGEQPVDQVFADIVAVIDGLLEGSR